MPRPVLVAWTSHFLLPSTFLIYLYHSTSIDLELSRLCNSTYCKSLQLWPRIALSAEQSTELHHQIVLPHYFFHLVVSRASSNTKPIEHRTSYVEHRTSNIERRTSHVEHRTSNIASRTSKIEHRTKRTIKHRSHRISIALNIGYIKHWLN